MKRSAGVLMHITSLPSPYGIGSLGKEAYQFADFLSKAKQTVWQVLPLNPTGVKKCWGALTYLFPHLLATHL